MNVRVMNVCKMKMIDYHLNHTAFVFLRCSLFPFGRFVYTFLTLESFADELLFGLSSKSTLKKFVKLVNL